MVIKGHMNTINSLSRVIAVRHAIQLQSPSTVSHVTTINTEVQVHSVLMSVL